MEKTPQELYQEREKRFNDAIHLKVPDRVPIAPLFTFFAAKYAGITCREAMLDYEKLVAGTAEQTREYTKRLIDVVGKGGGYILNGDIGIPDEAKPENVKAMFDFARKYGVYA